MPHFELLGKRRTWVTPYQEVQTSRSKPESIDAPNTTNFYVFHNAAKALQDALFGCDK